MIEQEVTEQQKAIISVVKWWSNKLKCTINPQGIPGDRESESSLFMLFTSITIQQNENITEDGIEKFERLLASYLVKEAEEGAKRVILSTDYGPEWPLSEICSNAGVESLRFPMKTSTYINFDDNTASYSVVRGPYGSIYPAG